MEEHAHQEEAQAQVEPQKKNMDAQGVSSLQQQILDKYAVFFAYLDKLDARLEAQLKLVEQRNLTNFQDKEKDRIRAAAKEEKDQEALRYGRSKLQTDPASLRGNALASAVEAASPAMPSVSSVNIPGASPIPGPTQVAAVELTAQVNVAMGPHLPDTMANSSSTQARASIPEVSMPVASPKQNLHQAQIQSQEAQMANEAKPNSQALPPFDGPYNKTQAASLNQCAPTHMGPQSKASVTTYPPVDTKQPQGQTVEAMSPNTDGSAINGNGPNNLYGAVNAPMNMGPQSSAPLPDSRGNFAPRLGAVGYVDPTNLGGASHGNGAWPNQQPNQMPNQMEQTNTPSLSAQPMPAQPISFANDNVSNSNNGYPAMMEEAPLVEAAPVSDAFYGSDLDDEVDAENSRTFTESDLNLGLSGRPTIGFDKERYEDMLLGIRKIMKPADYLSRVRDDYTELLMKAKLQEMDMSVLGVSVREVVSLNHWVIHLPQESQYLCSRNDYPDYIGGLFSHTLGQAVTVEFKFEESHGILPGSPLALAHEYYDGHFNLERQMLLTDPNFQEIISKLNLNTEGAHFDLVMAKEPKALKTK